MPIPTTPGDLDSAARKIWRRIEHDTSVQGQWRVATEFIRETRGLPSAWMWSYLQELAPRHAALTRHPYVQHGELHLWEACVEFHLQHGDGETQRIAWRKCARNFGQMGQLRELHELFRRHGLATREVDDAGWMAIHAAGQTPHARFIAYGAALPPCGAHDVCGSAAAEWRQLRDEGQVQTVLLHQGGVGEPLGVILGLRISATRVANDRTEFTGTLSEEGAATTVQLRRALVLARGFLAEAAGASTPRLALAYSYAVSRATLGGGSLGLAAAVGSVHAVSALLNLRRRWRIPPATALIGSVDDNGLVEDGRWETVEAKLRTVFFSHVERVAIPAGHLEQATLLLRTLGAEHPMRPLLLVGVRSVSDSLGNEFLAMVEERNALDLSAEFLRRHRTILSALVAIIAVFLIAWFAWKANFDYPNLEHALGLKVSDNAIVFNPRDSLEWCFRDHDSVKAAVVPFGDLVVGDAQIRNFWIWNMTPQDRDVLIELDGPDAQDWFISWRGGRQTLPTARDLRMYVTFAPLTPGAAKTAALVLRDPGSRGELYRITLTGAAGPPLPGGYALEFDGVDDMVEFGSRSTAFNHPERTLEFWFAADSGATGPLITDQRNRPEEPTYFNSMIIVLDDTTFQVVMGKQWPLIHVDRREGLTSGRWHHIALAHSQKRQVYSLVLDGVERYRHTDGFLFDGPGMNNVLIGALERNLPQVVRFTGRIDEVRVWDRMLTPAEIRRAMHTPAAAGTPHLVGLWDMDMIAIESAYSGVPNAHNGDLRGNPAFVRSAVPHPVRQMWSRPEDGHAGVRLATAAYLQCSRPLLSSHSDATFLCRYREDDGRRSICIDYRNAALSVQHLSCEGDSLWFAHSIPTSAIVAPRPAPGWHTVCIVFTADGVGTLFIDGRRIGSKSIMDPGFGQEADHDWMYRYSGFQIGGSDDGYNSFGSGRVNGAPGPLCVADAMVWARALSPDEVRTMSVDGAQPSREGLVAWWPLTGDPDGNNNWLDVISGQFMHLKWVKAWGGEGRNQRIGEAEKEE